MSTPFPATGRHSGSGRAALRGAAGTLWYLPGSFGIVRILGLQYSLRCVLFHDVSDTESAFTRGLGITITRKNFEAALRFLTRHYTPVSLQDVLEEFASRLRPKPPVLVTFDDAYKSVSEFAAPLCAEFGVPAIFFINAACLDNHQIALDNLVCYVANLFGLDMINAAIRIAIGTKTLAVCTLAEVFSRFLPLISLRVRKVFRDALVELAHIDESSLAIEAGLYLSSQQLCGLGRFNVEIGNHTYSHIHVRRLLLEDLAEEVDRNKAVLEAISGRKVRTFSVPYGSSDDLTTELSAHLQRSGYEAIFLAGGRSNSAHTHRLRVDRVSMAAGRDAAFFAEIEVLPRMRTIRDWLLATSNSESRRRRSQVEVLPATRDCIFGENAGSSSAACKGHPGL